MTIFKGLNRLEAFSDGVFAIALTLLVLDVRLPETGAYAHSSALWQGLWHLWPQYFSFLVAFVTVLISWVGHHIIGQIRQVNIQLLVANGPFLLTVSFLPFPTAVVGDHLGGASAARLAHRSRTSAEAAR